MVSTEAKSLSQAPGNVASFVNRVLEMKQVKMRSDWSRAGPSVLIKEKEQRGGHHGKTKAEWREGGREAVTTPRGLNDCHPAQATRNGEDRFSPPDPA